MASRWRFHGFVVGKYLLFQVPSWAVAAVLAAAAVDRFDVSAPWAWGLAGAWVVKDLALFPFVRRAYEPGDSTPGASLVGLRGVATEALDPSGYVRLGSELWRATLAQGVEAVPQGGSVRVRSVRGLTLVVGPDGEAPDP